jgi:hypothetical protein
MSAPTNPYFRLVIVTGSLFAFTVMCLLASTLGDPRAPPSRFFDAYGTPLIVIETIAVAVVSFRALAVDRRQMLASARGASAPGATEPPSPASDPTIPSRP